MIKETAPVEKLVHATELPAEHIKWIRDGRKRAVLVPGIEQGIVAGDRVLVKEPVRAIKESPGFLEYVLDNATVAVDGDEYSRILRYRGKVGWTMPARDMPLKLARLRLTVTSVDAVPIQKLTGIAVEALGYEYEDHLRAAWDSWAKGDDKWERNPTVTFIGFDAEFMGVKV
jgi:hypothetical protein